MYMVPTASMAAGSTQVELAILGVVVHGRMELGGKALVLVHQRQRQRRLRAGLGRRSLDALALGRARIHQAKLGEAQAGAFDHKLRVLAKNATECPARSGVEEMHTSFWATLGIRCSLQNASGNPGSGGTRNLSSAVVLNAGTPWSRRASA